jgi:hypothetical protein
MKAFFAGLVIGIILVPAAVYLYFWLGYAPVSTKAAPLPFERKLAGMALDKRIEKEAPKESPVQPTEQNLLAGCEDLYRELRGLSRWADRIGDGGCKRDVPEATCSAAW